MQASVSLLDLSWSTPDGTPLLKHLNLTFGAERTGIVGRNGSGKSTLLRLIAGDLRPASGSAQVTGTLAMMRQDVTAHPQGSIADLLGVGQALRIIDDATAGRASAPDLAEVDWALPTRVDAALLRCGLAIEPQTPLAHLSGGQRSRAALAALLLAEPDMLLLDEPTNNLDRAGRQAVIDVIRNWNGGLIVVSHDRTLLEEMDAIVALTSLGATRYGGNYTAYRQQQQVAQDAAAHALAQAEKASADAARAAQTAAERKARKDASGHRARAKGDKPKIAMDAAKARAEASGGAGARLHTAKRAAAAEATAAARAQVEVIQPLQMDIPPTGLPATKVVLALDGVAAGYDAGQPLFQNFSFTVTGPQRIAITGANGSGKTTLLRIITGQLTPLAGHVDIMAPFALLDQHLGDIDQNQNLRDTYLRRNPAATPHMAHIALARFGFRAADALRSAATLSGGERLRLGLACTLAAAPAPMLLILDEPTNHLDLDAITALEDALADYDGAIIAVSHDDTFLDALAIDKTIELGI